MVQKPHVSLFSLNHHKLFANLKNEDFFHFLLHNTVGIQTALVVRVFCV